MENIPNAGEQPVQQAPVANATVIPPVTLTPEQAETMAKALEEAQQLAEKKAEEAENYKRGMLKAKGKLKDAGLDEEDEKPVLTKEDIASVVREELAAAKPQEVNEVDKLRIVNTELVNALRNKPTTPTSAGGNADRPEPSAHSYWSKEQVEDLKRRGLDPDVVYKNMQATGAPGQMVPNPLPENK